MKIEVRKSRPEDEKAVVEIYNQAKEYFAEVGTFQWVDGGYPDEEEFNDDIKNGVGYVVTADDKVVGVAALIDERDEDYSYIEDGAWLNDEDYVVVHRIAVHKEYKGKGIGAALLHKAEEIALESNKNNVRIDTHEENTPMQRLVEKDGYVRCGIIYVMGKLKRIAYQKVIKP